jgi:Domain of unknown function (DUF2760)
VTKHLHFLALGLTLLLAVAVLPIKGMPHAAVGAIALVLSVAITFFLFRQRLPAPAPAPIAPAAVETKGSAEAEVIAFLALLQKKGRLIDFLMEDISKHDDASVGAVARVVYQGCRDVLNQHLKVVPLAGVPEGSSLTVPAGYRAVDYELSGKLGGSAPFTGTLEHQGWKVESIKLPRIVETGDGALPPLAPAQVTVR